MKKTLSIIGILVLGFFLLTAAWISPAVGESKKLGGDETPVAETIETPSFGTEDGVGAMEYSDVVESSALPEPAPQELSLDNYHPD